VVGRGPGSVSRESIPADPSLPFAELAPLLELGEEARIWVARHPSTPEEVLAELATDASEKVQRVICERKGKSAQLQRRLAQSQHGNMRYKLASDAELLPEYAAMLAKDKDSFVRREVAQNPVADETLLSALARDPDPFVREKALTQERLSAETLEALAEDPRPDVVDAVAAHWNTPGPVLARIAERGLTPARAKSLAARVATPPELLSKFCAQPELHLILAGNPGIPPAVSLALAQSKDWQVRSAVAGNAGADAAALELLIDDTVTVVKMKLATHPRFTRLMELATDPDDSVRESLARRRDAPIEVLEFLARDGVERVRKAAAESLKRRG
jgi:hypothetical protein